MSNNKFSFAEILETVTIPSDPHTRKEIFDVVRDISDQWYKMDGLKSIVKEAITACAEKHEIPKKYIRKLARAYHAQTFEKEQQENGDFAALYEVIVGHE